MTGYFALALQYPEVFLAPDFAGFMGMVILGFALIYLRAKVLTLFPQPRKERKPLKMNAEELRKIIKNKFDILLAGGQDHLKGKIFRVGHLGYINDRDIITVINAISSTLFELGKITALQAGEALVAATKCLEAN